MTAGGGSVHELTGAYVLGALDAAETAAFEEHLDGCAACRAEIAELGEAVLALSALTETAPPADLGAAVAAATQPRPEAGAGRLDRLDKVVRRWQLAAAAAVIVALGAVGWGLLPQPDLDRQLVVAESGADARISELVAAPDLEVSASDPGEEIRGTVLRSESLGLAAMIVHDLPTLTPAQTFQAWTIVGSGPLDAGVFAGTDGTATVLLTGDLASVDVVAVSIEPAGGSDAPTGDIVLQVPITG